MAPDSTPSKKNSSDFMKRRLSREEVSFKIDQAAGSVAIGNRVLSKCAHIIMPAPHRARSSAGGQSQRQRRPEAHENLAG